MEAGPRHPPTSSRNCRRANYATFERQLSSEEGDVAATYQEGMTKDECLQFTASALTLAVEHDGSSGGVIRLAAFQESGVEQQALLGDQIPKPTIATLPSP